MSEVTKRTIPVVPVVGKTLLPGMILYFDIAGEKRTKAVENAMKDDHKAFLVTAKEMTPDHSVKAEDLDHIGTIADIKSVIKVANGLTRLQVEGLERAELFSFDDTDYFKGEVSTYPVEPFKFESEAEREAMLRTLKSTYITYCKIGQNVSQNLMSTVIQIDDLEKLVTQIAIQTPMTLEQSRQFLECIDLKLQYDYILTLLENQVEIYKIKGELRKKIRDKLDKNQKEYVLREQIRMMRDELGEGSSGNEIEDYREKCLALEASDEVKERILKEINRLNSVGLNNPTEGSVIRNYIETLLSMPWDHMSKDNEDLVRAEKILREDHYGLEKIKNRIMEFLAVRALTKKGESPILCLVGPPGTGKTSIAKSVARALDKKYIRLSLGGVHDEAEIRGHRRTYIGAMPGRIAECMRLAGVKNPLMLLDEIDKVGKDYRGDTSSALLEVLDPEQNVRFSDHYIEIPIDLSEVLFITTANDASTIPQPLLDRMEVIEVSSYTEDEKIHIAKEHLIPKQMLANGIEKKELVISDKAIEKIIAGYTREAGVRQLERQFGTICRKTALKIKKDGFKKVSVTVRNLEEFLGRAKRTVSKVDSEPQIGIVTGLAWTSVGGEILEIEVNIMPGKGDFKLTGHLGDVMKESAVTGISYLRSIADDYGIDPKFFTENDIHIHIPEGAVPKDGPSAGITMATAMLSAIAKIPVHAHLAMTGEITLRGRVLPIGGLKEKLLAAKKSGVTKVLVPVKNRPDVEEMSEEITGGLTIVYVDTMEKVLSEALVRK